jgi:hypothetical protein
MTRELVFLTAFIVGSLSCEAGDKKFDIPIRKAETLQTTTTTTDAPVGPTFGPVMCDDSGSIYFRYFPVGTSGSGLIGGLAKVNRLGHFTELAPAKLFSSSKPPEVFFYSVASDGRIYEIIHQYEAPHDGRPGVSKTHLGVVDKDGTLVSSHSMAINVFPNFLVPLSNGDVFMGGTESETPQTGEERREPFLGIIASDGSLKYSIPRPKVNLTKEERENGTVDPAIHRGAAVLGPDGFIYLLLARSPPQMQVITPDGKIVREFTPASPLQNTSASALFVSGGRLLLSQYGKNSIGKNSLLWIVYDAQTGEPVSAFEPPPQSGRPACWEDGKYLKFLTVNKSTGQFNIVSVSLQ